MIAMSATPLGPFAYIVVFLVIVSFLLGLYAGYLMKPPELHLKDRERHQAYVAGYQQGYLDNSDNTKAFQQGYTHGYNQAVIDLSKPRAPQAATAPMQQAQTKQEEEPTEHDNRHSNAHWQSRQFIDQLYAGINAE